MQNKDNKIAKIFLTILLLSGSGHLLFTYMPSWEISGLQAPYGMFTFNLMMGEAPAIKLYDSKTLEREIQISPGTNFLSGVLIPSKAFMMMILPLEKNIQEKAFSIVLYSLCRNEYKNKGWKLVYSMNGGSFEKNIICSR